MDTNKIKRRIAKFKNKRSSDCGNTTGKNNNSIFTMDYRGRDTNCSDDDEPYFVTHLKNKSKNQCIQFSNNNNNDNIYRSKQNNSSIKPSAIMSLPDTNIDIVVIDKTDINESVKNENNIIILKNLPSSDYAKVLRTGSNANNNSSSGDGDSNNDYYNVDGTSNNNLNMINDNYNNLEPTNEMHLVDVLGDKWPDSSGAAGQILNNDHIPTSYTNLSNINNSTNINNFNKSNSRSSYQGQPRTERNKSSNPLSHLKSTTKINNNRQSKENYIITSDIRNPFDKGTLRDENNSNNNTLNASTSSTAISNTNRSSFGIDFPLSEITSLPVIAGTNLEVGSMVEIQIDASEYWHGVLRWIGKICNFDFVGVELEEDIPRCDRRFILTDGTYKGHRLFKCQPGRALFIETHRCSSDHRFKDEPTNQQSQSKIFEQFLCPIVKGSEPPIKILLPEQCKDINGKGKGIQGHHNSCYLDATLFSMFAFTGVFDSILIRKPEAGDIQNYTEVQEVLREEIVNPLRKNKFVRGDRVMKLRQLLAKLTTITGLTTEEKDPEEFLNCLLSQILKADPFLKLNSGQDTFYYQLFVEKEERLKLPTVQQLFEQSFWSSDIKLKEVPSCLIIQMPRFGKDYKMYPRILPSTVLDVTDIIEDSPRQCTVCGGLAEYECKKCFQFNRKNVGLECTVFCRICLETTHKVQEKCNHEWKQINIPQEFEHIKDRAIPRIFMELFAVVCIETSHYVSFAKMGPGIDAPWCFFDSMADRKGEINGYNIPEIVLVPDLPKWLSDEGSRILNEENVNDKMLPEHAKRLLCDAYMCMYQSPDVMMYK